ncbi:MAG: macrolide ABC transporter ATP-binding protein [Myxococcales bacterium]|nr:macrolide ABC transporter ATP-binding protein [Myxococcales bacterium]
MNANTTTIIETQAACKFFGEGESLVKAVNHVDLKIETGEFTAIAGPSGSGKSTLLNIISGLDHVTSGKIYMNGAEVTQYTDKELAKLRLEHIGFVFQNYNLLPVLTAYENAEYILMLRGMPENERRDKVMAVLEKLGIADKANNFPSQLSGGQQQRVAIARAIAANPTVVLADEPTANLDSKTAASLVELMAELNEKEGITFLFSSHDPRILDCSKRVLVLTDGVISDDRTNN